MSCKRPRLNPTATKAMNYTVGRAARDACRSWRCSSCLSTINISSNSEESHPQEPTIRDETKREREEKREKMLIERVAQQIKKRHKKLFKSSYSPRVLTMAWKKCARLVFLSFVASNWIEKKKFSTFEGARRVKLNKIRFIMFELLC